MNIAKGASTNTLIMKFGGTSVGSVEVMLQVASIVQDARKKWKYVAVVTSAMAGVTNSLLKLVNTAIDGNREQVKNAIQELRERHLAVLDAISLPDTRKQQTIQEIETILLELQETCKAISILSEASPRSCDVVASTGERLAVRVLSAVLESTQIKTCFIDSSRIIVTDDTFQNALPDFVATKARADEIIQPLFAENYTPVITGFIGGTPDGVITTLGRGGSDYSAAILSSVLNANEVWIWTDVDGVMSADPRLVKDAVTIPELTFREVAELAYYGAKVLHPKTIRPIIESNIGLRVCNTFNPQHPGTRLLETRDIRKGTIKAVTAIPNLDLMSIEGRGMLGVPGVAARTFSAVAETGTSVPMITQSSSEQTITFAVPQESSATVMAALEKTFAREIRHRDIDGILKIDSVAIVTTVGAGMAQTAGISGMVFSALGNAKVNVMAIAQGSSEVSISFVVAEKDLKSALVAIHALILDD
ncbi:MAG: aspartate kinase [Anaerolineaceae bacterium]|nr:aspartate kinase [Anaerolineaceae bacterium]